MQRTNIYLDEAQCARLDRLAGQEGLSRSQLIRRFVDQGLAGWHRDLSADLASIAESFGALTDEAGTALDATRGPDDRSRWLQSLREG